jgi:tetrapyrrole methylase family protein / MazG family protein
VPTSSLLQPVGVHPSQLIASSVAEVFTGGLAAPADGLQIVALAWLTARPFDPGMGLLIVPAGDGAAETGLDNEGASLPGRAATRADQPLLLLRRLYPAAHPVVCIRDGRETALSEIDEAQLAATPHYLPPLEPLRNAASLNGLPWLVARLRGPGGCPWDAEQNHLSLRPFLLEEAYEVYDALEDGSGPELAEELGDLLLQIVLHAQYGAEEGTFDLADVERAVFEKIVRRHPHVFGEVEARTSDEVIRNWEQIKAGERASGVAPTKKVAPDMPAAFAGLSRSLPALAYASEMQARAASLGYDWPDLEGVIDKIAEEASELLAAGNPAEETEEYGDLLFVMVNLGRKLNIDPEGALRAAARKFAARFARVERYAGHRGLELRALGLDALDDLWQEAKREEAADKTEAETAVAETAVAEPMRLPDAGSAGAAA